uniref:AP-1 complex subunit sigma-2 n=1 Tax=Ailuropoda melanoleuca TaxID=9646 RepID=A0A7N5K6Q9_AILME
MRPIGFLGLCGHLRCLRCRSRKPSCFPRVAQPAPPLAATPAPPSSGPQGGVCRLALPSPLKPSFPPLTGSPPHSNTASLLQAGDRGFPSASAATATAADDDDQVQPRPRPAAAMQFMLLFSRQGKLRLQKWYVPLSDKEKKKITRELVQTVLARKPKMCSFLEWRDLKIVYKRYASLYFCCAIEDQDNELITLEIIHRYVELLDKYFGSVCELDIIFNFEKAYFILDEFLLGGEVQETSKKNVLKAIEQADLLQESQNEEWGGLSEDIL